MNRVSGLYKIVNKANGKFYIGSSDNINRRFSRHLLDLSKDRHDNEHLQKAWKKYGKEAFVFEIYKSCEPLNLLEEEQKELDIWVGKDECYNMRRDAKCPVNIGEHRSEEIKRKISLAQKGKPKWNDEQKEHFRQINLGKKHSQETIEKFRLRKHTDETKEKISKASKNQMWSIERCKNISEQKKNSHKKFTEEELVKIKEGVKKSIENGRFGKNKIPLSEYENIKSLYLSGSFNKRKLAFKYGISPASMAKLLKRIGV